jgi:hypothetical protein
MLAKKSPWRVGGQWKFAVFVTKEPRNERGQVPAPVPPPLETRMSGQPYLRKFFQLLLPFRFLMFPLTVDRVPQRSC